MSRKHLSSIINGRAGISPAMAIHLDKVFGGDASTWYHLQADYDLAQALHKTTGRGEDTTQQARKLEAV